MDPRKKKEPAEPANAEAQPLSDRRRRPRLTPLPSLGPPKAVVLAPDSPELDVLSAALGPGWELKVAASASELEALDPRTRLVVLDDRCTGGALLELAKKAVERARAARVLLAVAPGSIGDVLAAGLERVPLGFLFRPLTEAGLESELRALFSSGAKAGGPSDRRGFPRVALDEAAVVGPAGVDLRNISPGGALLIAPPDVSPGSRLPLDLRLTPGAPVQRVVAEILHTEDAPLGRRAVAARFLQPTSRFQDLVRAAVLEQLTRRDLRELSRRLRDEGTEREPLTALERITAVLRAIHADRRPCTVTPQSGGRPWRAAIVGLDEGGGRIELERPRSGRRPRAEDRLEVFGRSAVESYLFEVDVLEVHDATLWCSRPGVIYHSEKRTQQRRPVPHGTPAVVELEAPPPWGKRRWPLLDVSSNGLSFAIPAGEALMLPGTPLRRIRLLVDGRCVAEYAAEVRHVAPRPDGSVQVGVGVIPSPRATTAARRPRPARGHERHEPAPIPGAHPAPPGARRVRFLNSRNEVVAGLVNTSVAGGDRLAMPVVVVAPAFGRTKECFSTLAEWICDRFRRLGKPVAVLRFDYTHSNGESHVPEANRAPGRECLDFTLSSALDDLHAAIRFAHESPLFEPSSVTVVGYSVSAPLALRATAEDPRVRQVVSVMGAASLQECVRNVTGGLDYVAGHLRGHRHGVVNFLGFLVDMDEICRDAVARGFATVSDTARDVAALSPHAAASWLVGEHDGWVDRRELERVLESKRGVPPDVVLVPTGHVPTQSEEAAAVAEETTRLVWRAVHGGELPAGPGPTPEALERAAREEWALAPRASVGDRRAYWASYLLGEKAGELGFDVLESVGAYRDFMAQQVRLLDARPDEVVLDAGGGTGNFLAALLESGRPLPARVEIADLVPEALARARVKTRAAVERAGLAVDFRVKTLEVSRLRPVERFIRGEVHGPEWLRGRVEGLDDRTLDHLLALYGPAMHETLRGGDLDGRLAQALGDEERAVVADLGRAARLVRGCLGPDDFRGGVPAAGSGAGPVRTSQLRFERLAFGDAAVDERLDLETDAYDAVIASLVLPYLINPDETVRELHRALRPGGRLVVSSNRPNTDMSLIFTRLVDDVASGRAAPPAGMSRERFLEELRAYTNSAAFLLRLAEEQTFRFFEPDRLGELVEHAGFRNVEVQPGFGEPPQAYVAVGRKP